jgi:hypothetical protein
MNGKTSFVLALIVAFAASAVALYAYDPGNEIVSDDEAAVQIAKEFILNAPTYAFDGIDGTLQVLETMALESWPVQYIVILSFDCVHAGYGDRSDTDLRDARTTHIATVKVVNGEVVLAVIDGVWDELHQHDHIIDPDLGNNGTVSTDLPRVDSEDPYLQGPGQEDGSMGIQGDVN